MPKLVQVGEIEKDNGSSKRRLVGVGSTIRDPKDKKSFVDAIKGVSPLIQGTNLARAAFGEEESREDVLAQAMRELEAGRTEVTSPLSSGMSTAAFGVPRMLANKAGLEEEIFPEQETFGGKSLRFGSEVLGLTRGGAAGLSRGAGKKLVPNVASNIGLSSAPGTIAAFRAARLGRNIGRGAIEGGVFGGVQIFNPETNLVQQGLQAFTGGLAGAILPILGASSKSIARSFKNFSSTPKRSSLTRLSEVEKGVKSAGRKEVAVIKKRAAQELDDTVNVLKTNSKNLEDKLYEASVKGTENIQGSLREFSRAASDAYGKQLDDISQSMINKGKTITKGQFNDFLNNIAKELDEIDNLTPDVLRNIQSMRNRFGIKIIGQPNKFISQRTGQAIGGSLKSNVDDVIPFKDLAKEVKDINKLFSNQLKSTGQFGQGDVSVSILRKNFGNILGDEFKQLNSEYGRVANALKFAYRVFKPGKGEFGVSQGVSTLEKLGKGKLGLGEQRALQLIEQGSEIGGKKIPGVGSFSDDIIGIGNELSKTKEMIKQSPNTINKSTSDKIHSVRNQLEKRLSGLDNRKQVIQDIMAGKELRDATVRSLRNAGGLVLTLAGVLSILSALGGSKR